MKMAATTDHSLTNFGLHGGEVIEIEIDGEPATALVLLASEQGVIVDLLDDSTPAVILWEELHNVRVFSPMVLAAA